jgi:hypothetical protein
MPISTVSQKGLDAPLSLTAPNLGTPSAINLTNATALPSAALPTGCVLQVVQGTYNSPASASTSTFVDSGITTSITPKFSTSKILVIAYLGMCSKSASDTQLNLRIQRSGGTIFSAASMNQGAATALTSNPTLVYLDSPSTTSSTTYLVQLANRDNAGGVSTNANGTATITLMEIAA